MLQRRRTKITIETERVLVIGKTRSTFDAWCPACYEQVRLLRLEEAAALAACLRACQRPPELEKLHIIPTPDGLMNVCLNSLLNQG